MNKARSRRQAETPAAETLEAELDRIAALGLDDLRALWLKMTGQVAPRVLSRNLLARMLAYRAQEQRLGKLGRKMRQRLDGLARGSGEPVRHLKVGTVLVRERQGTLHEVMVVSGGFSWRDKTYPSLSAIAMAITGTSWNGPRFFGLRAGKGDAELSPDQPPIKKTPPRSSTRSSVRSLGIIDEGLQQKGSVEPARAPQVRAAQGKAAQGGEDVRP